MRAVIFPTHTGSEGCLDLIRVALLVRTVAMGFRPAERIVRPDSVVGCVRFLVMMGFCLGEVG